MSTDGPVAESDGGRAAGGGKGFRLVVLLTIVGLAIGALSVGAAAYARGPQIRSVSVSPGALIAKPGQQIVVHGDQPLRPVDPASVSISPAVPVEVASSGGDVTVSFPGMLDYATQYSLELRLTGAQTGIASTVGYVFSTPDATVYSLVRKAGSGQGDGAPDQVLRNAVKGRAGQSLTSVLLEGTRVQSFAVLDDLVMTIEADRDGAERLVLSDPSQRLSTTVPTPAGATITSLRVSPTASVFGYTLGAPLRSDGDTDLRGRLLVYDPYDASGIPKTIVGPAGDPLRALDWRFVPGTSSLVVQTDDEQLYLVDYLAGSVSPMGRHATLHGFLPGSLDLVVSDFEVTSVVDLATGVTTPLSLPALDVDRALFPSRVVVLSPSSFVQEVHRIDFARQDKPLTSSVYLVDGGGTRLLFAPPADGSRIDDLCTSPNGEYLAVEVIPPGSRIDDYPQPGYEDVITFLVDIADGSSARSFPGTRVDWCD